MGKLRCWLGFHHFHLWVIIDANDIDETEEYRCVFCPKKMEVTHDNHHKYGDCVCQYG